MVRLIGNGVITIVLFALMPFELAQRTSVDMLTGFQLRKSNAGSFLAAALLGLSLWPVAIEFARMQSGSLEQTEEIKELFQRVSASLNAVPLAVKLVALALIPAVCEELFFRGYLMTAFRTSMSNPLAILLSGSLFGLFHVISTLSFERFIPTFFLGLVLGWICCRAKSVLPGMLLHTVHNSLILSMHAFEKELTALGIGTEAADHVPRTWLIGSGIISLAAIGLMTASNRKKQDATEKQPTVSTRAFN